MEKLLLALKHCTRTSSSLVMVENPPPVAPPQPLSSGASSLCDRPMSAVPIFREPSDAPLSNPMWTYTTQYFLSPARSEEDDREARRYEGDAIQRVRHRERSGKPNPCCWLEVVFHGRTTLSTSGNLAVLEKMATRPGGRGMFMLSCYACLNDTFQRILSWLLVSGVVL